MLTLFECRVRYTKRDEFSGKEKRVTEPYLFDALTYTEAENRVAETMSQYISGDFQLVSVRKTRYADIITSEDGDRWFNVRVSFLIVDEDTGKEKRLKQLILTQASNIKDAIDKTVEGLNGNTPDFEVHQAAETMIMDYFPLFDKDEELKDKEISRKTLAD